MLPSRATDAYSIIMTNTRSRTQASPNYSDRHAAEELRKEVRRYSADKESCFISVCDFCVWLFKVQLQQDKTAKMIEREKLDAISALADPLLKESDQKSLLQWLVWRLFMEHWPGSAIIIDNYASQQYGELDDERYETKEAKEAALKAIEIRHKTERKKKRDLQKWLITPSTIVKNS